MATVVRAEKAEIRMPDRYRHDTRLSLWYKCGFNQAQKGFTPSENWLDLVSQDRLAWEAFNDGRRAAETHHGYSLAVVGRWAR